MTAYLCRCPACLEVALGHLLEDDRSLRALRGEVRSPLALALLDRVDAFVAFKRQLLRQLERLGERDFRQRPEPHRAALPVDPITPEEGPGAGRVAFLFEVEALRALDAMGSRLGVLRLQRCAYRSRSLRHFPFARPLAHNGLLLGVI